jgi:16S rRNA (uracil1498-N3)-methyltransferase
MVLRPPSDPPLSEPAARVERPKVRLYVDQPLGPGQQVTLPPEAAHYLFAVMRMGAGDRVALFDGRAGEWAADLSPQGKRGGTALCLAQTAPQRDPADLWLVFAPLKKARTDFLVEKATELGVARLVPVQTAHTNAERIRRDRLQAQVREAAEQCGATHLPQVDDLRPLGAVLDAWPAGRALFWADEGLAGAAPPAEPTAGDDPPGPAALLIGPEGGFSPAERARLSALPFVRPLRLGPRILRAETAAVAALVLWQARHGDWA